MATQQIQKFAQSGTVEDGDVMVLEDYIADSDRQKGNQAGIARRALVNMVLRQSAHMAAGLAQFIANRYSSGVLDDGDLDKIEQGLESAISAIGNAHASRTDNPHSVTYSQVGAAAAGHNHSGVYQPLDSALTSLAGLSLVGGDILYATGSEALARLAKGTDGQMLKLVGGVPSWADAQGITVGSKVATTSGTYVDFTGLSSPKRVSFDIMGVSTNGNSSLMLQLGTSGGLVTSGYTGKTVHNSYANVDSSSFLLVPSGVGSASAVWYGRVVLELVDAANNVWALSAVMCSTTDYFAVSGGYVSLSGTLTQFRFSTVSGDTFDAGSVAYLIG